MSVSDRALQVDNRKKHEAACRELRKHLPSFSIVGEQLSIIHDVGVWKETHKTLEAFFNDEFGLERRRAYEYMEAAKVVANLCSNGTQMSSSVNERQCREIAKAPPEKQAEVVRKAAETAAKENRKPTANDYKKVVSELVYEDMEPECEKIDDKPPKGKQFSPEDQATANRKLVKDYIAKAVNAADDYHTVNPNQRSRAHVIKLLQQAGADLW